MAIIDIETEDENYIICETLEDFNKFCEEGGWGDHIGFKQDTGIDYDILLNKPFTVVHSRVYLKE